MQLRVRMDLSLVALGFLECVEQNKRVELVNDFVAASAAIVVAMDVEGIIHGDD